MVPSMLPHAARSRPQKGVLSAVVLLPVFSIVIVRNMQSTSNYPVEVLSTVSQPSNGSTERIRLRVENDTATIGMPTTARTRSNVRLFHRTAPHPERSSGRLIEDQLFCHAYAYKEGMEYGGACGSGNRTYDEQKQLLASIGLLNELPYACARDFLDDTTFRSRSLPRDQYAKDDTRLFIPEYLSYLRSKVVYPAKTPDVFTVAVHVKRGKVTPCSRKRKDFVPYLPNSHYLKLIDIHSQRGARVVVFSEASSGETFDDFLSRGYEVQVDGSETEVWKTIVNADVVILSRSSFGMIPALVTKAKVIYTPFWHPPIRDWQIVRDTEILQSLDEEISRLSADC